MKTKNNSIFNLIEIFRNTTNRVSKQLFKTNCETNFNDDYYCDAEKI
ncbi:hypothetical protein [Dokdonia sp. PRO95]|nr:hypothetical protein [Dokdonia sp. PRO95]